MQTKHPRIKFYEAKKTDANNKKYINRKFLIKLL